MTANDVTGVIEKFGMVSGQPQIVISGKQFPMSISCRGVAKSAGIDVGDTVTAKIYCGTVTEIRRSTVPATQIPREGCSSPQEEVSVSSGAPAAQVNVTGLPAVQEVRHVQVPAPTLDDSIEIGTPGKGGVLKVRFNAARPEEADDLIRSGYRRLQLARGLTDGSISLPEEDPDTPLPERSSSRDEVVVAS